MSYVPYRRPPAAGLKIWAPPIAISAFLWWFSSNVIPVRQGLLATALLVIPFWAYRRWQQSGKTLVPLYAMLALAYWAAFAMPLFWADPPADPQTDVRFGEAAVSSALGMAVLGVGALGLGMRVRFHPINPALMPDISDTPGSWRYLYCAMAIGTILSVNEQWLSVFGNGGWQLMTSLANTVPLAICAMLAARQIDGTATRGSRYALGAFLTARVVTGIASGWLGPVLFMGVILALVYTSKYRRLPVRMIALIVPVALFFQVGKTAFREVYWTEGKTGSIFEKSAFWMENSFRQWNSVLTHRDRQGTADLLAESINRMALLSQSVNVIEKTPRVVAFQDGKTYSYLAATLIPRIVWPGKPSMNDANRFYQVAYGLTEKEDLQNVSIAVGCLTESFINFGWWGVAPVMFTLGLVLGLFERTLLAEDSSVLFCGIGLALLSVLLAIAGQAAQYLGGLLQQIAVVFVVALPVIRRRKVDRWIGRPGEQMKPAIARTAHD